MSRRRAICRPIALFRWVRNVFIRTAKKHESWEFDFSCSYPKFSCEPKTPTGLWFVRHTSTGQSTELMAAVYVFILKGSSPNRLLNWVPPWIHIR